MIRLLIADDHPIVRAGIVGLFADTDGFDVVAEAASGEAAVALAAAHRPAVVLMDLRMPGIGGVAATREIVAASEARVLVFTTYEDDDQILAAIEAGASGYLLKAAPAAELLAGVTAVAGGHTVLAPAIAAQLVARAGGAGRAMNADPIPRLTSREVEILDLVAAGHSNPGIARLLCIGESTVKTHLLHVFEKLAVRDRTRAVTRALELGILPRRS